MNYPIRFVHCFDCHLPVTPRGMPKGGASTEQAKARVARLCEMLAAHKVQVTP